MAEVALSAVPAECAGAAGSIAETRSELSNALGITVLGSIAALSFRLSGLRVVGRLGETLGNAGITPAVADQVKDAFASGLHIVIYIGGQINLTFGNIAWLWLPRKLSE